MGSGAEGSRQKGYVYRLKLYGRNQDSIAKQLSSN